MAIAEPFQFTVEEAVKFVPFTVSPKADVPAMADDGEMEVVVGAGGLLTAIALLNADVTPEEVAQTLMLCAVEYCIAV